MRPFSISECLPRPPSARLRGRFHAGDDADRATERQARPRIRLGSCRVAWPPGRAGRPGEAGPAREQARGGHRAPTGHHVSSEDDEAALSLGPSGFSEAGSAREDEPNPNVEIRRKSGACGLRLQAPSASHRGWPGTHSSTRTRRRRLRRNVSSLLEGATMVPHFEKCAGGHAGDAASAWRSGRPFMRCPSRMARIRGLPIRIRECRPSRMIRGDHVSGSRISTTAGIPDGGQP